MSDFTTPCRTLTALTAQAQTACAYFLEKCQAQNLPVLITETYRSQARQNYLYCQGRTPAACIQKGLPKDFATTHANPNAAIVTWTLKSRHTTGLAWDVCKNLKGHAYDDPDFFRQIGQIAQDLGLIWGGTWDTPDTPHIELPNDWQPPQTLTPSPTPHPIRLNGQEKIANLILLDGHYYIKLQDLRDTHHIVTYDKIPIITCIQAKN
jgi:peptidoglycan L-alanyl-D-glutamate endopeptidase CwlK